MIEYESLAESNRPFFDELEQSFRKTLEGGWYILGTNVTAFEREFAAYVGTRACVGVASGLDALTLTLRAHRFPRGSEVIVPSNTYIATVLAILENGLRPVLVEPDIATYTIDPGRIEERITQTTCAIIVVHLYGKPCEMDPIVEIAKRRNLLLVEDCAQSHGATYNGRQTGTFGRSGAFSFYPTKNLGALGDGGCVTTDDAAFEVELRRLRNYGSDKKYYNEVAGVNSRLDEVQAGFLSVKLRHLNRIIDHKRRLAEMYRTGLKGDFILPVVRREHGDVFHIFTVRHPRRDALREHLLRKGIKTEIHYPVPPHRQTAMRGILDDGPYPVSEEIHATTLSLPISFGHRPEEIERVIEAMNAF